MTKKQLKDKKVIAEDLSKNLKQLLVKAAENMSNELGISLEEALYVTSLYGELKDKNLFNTSYMQNIKLIADEGEKIPDISNIQQMAKYPALMYDIIKYVLLESDDFTSNYTITYSDEKLTRISKKTPQSEEVKETQIELFSTPWDSYKVAEDYTYVTFELPKFNESLKNYYSKVFSEDPRITRNINNNFFITSWCVLSDPIYFGSQRANDTANKWFFTFLKKNPVDFMIEQVKRAGSLNDKTKNIITEALSKNLALPDSVISMLRNEYLGECFLMHKSGKSYGYPSGNFGYHNYNNSPGTATSSSQLKVKPAYSYFDLKFATERFTISGGTLLSYNFNEDVVSIPEGIVKIGKNAFNGKSTRVVILPKSLTTILNDAFIDCPNLEEIRATNTLSYIQQRAFSSASANQLVLGVFKEEPDGTITVSKPVSLMYYPKGAFNTGEVDAEADLTKESKKSKVVEAVRLASKPMYDYESRYFTIEHSVLTFNTLASGVNFNNFIIPEGVTFLNSQIFGVYNSIVFPSSFRGWTDTTEPLIASPTSNAVEILDFSKVSNVRVIQDKKFYFANTKLIILPPSIVTIGSRAFFLTTAKSIFIPSSVETISFDAFKNTNISTITTDNAEVLSQKLENVYFRYRPEIIQA